MKRLCGLTIMFTAALSVAAAVAAEPERIRGTVTAVSPSEITVIAATGKITMQAGPDTKYLTVVRSDLDHIAAGSYIGVAAKSVGEKQVALDVLIFPPAMKGAAEGHFGWDTIPDTTLAGGARTASAMTNGSVATTAEHGHAVTAASSMTNGSVASASQSGAVRQVTLTYNGGRQKILVPPTAPVVTLQPGTASDLKPGDKVFVNSVVDGDKTTAVLVLVGSPSSAPPI
jgi:hypothetical protein